MDIGPRQLRVLILAPTGRDAVLTQTILEEAGLQCRICPDAESLSAEATLGVGSVLVAEEAIVDEARRPLVDLLASQQPWSDLPIMILTHTGADSTIVAQAVANLGNVTLLERPVRVAALVSAIRSALRARERQYQIRAYIVEQRRSEEALREAGRRKDDFLAMLAHELRNPLAPVRTSLELMRLAADNVGLLEQARAMMERQVRHMVRLIDDLLDISRITRGKMRLQKSDVDLALIVQDAVDTVRPFIHESQQTLTLTLPQTPVYLRADAVRLAQVLSNLLDNAAKYTNRGGRISLTAERNDKDVTISVKDTGLGIPREMLGSIFEMFTQVDRSPEQSRSGLGIGLALAKQLIEMHGGNIEAKSAGLHQGSEFILRLPLQVDVPMSASKPRKEGKGICLRRILVVDDNRDAADALATLLRLQRNEARVAYDGIQGLAEVEVFKPHVVLLDLRMPGMGGLEMARRLRGLPAGNDIVLVAVTGYGQEEDKRDTKDAGFDHHLIKPVDPAALQKLLAEVRPSSASSL
jgi:signal transduction histidine kinase